MTRMLVLIAAMFLLRPILSEEPLSGGADLDERSAIATQESAIESEETDQSIPDNQGETTEVDPTPDQVAVTDKPDDRKTIRAAAAKAIELLEVASAGSAEQRTCFNCHGQAMPVIAFSDAKEHGVTVDEENFQRQVRHAHAHLKRGKKSYLEGKGQGGGVDTAGYALWTLEEGSREPDEVSDYVVDWLIDKQKDDGRWKCSSNRPPSEASDFTSTYLALRALGQFAHSGQSEKAEAASKLAANWLAEAKPSDTEDLVFYVLSLEYAEIDTSSIDAAIARLCGQQRDDGGWAQKEDMSSDAYATGSALYALSETGMSPSDEAWQKGIRFLLATQKADGSWHVVSRSKPFQKYFESGFPHQKDQFISTSATAWAAVALLRTLPDPKQ